MKPPESLRLAALVAVLVGTHFTPLLAQQPTPDQVTDPTEKKFLAERAAELRAAEDRSVMPRAWTESIKRFRDDPNVSGPAKRAGGQLIGLPLEYHESGGTENKWTKRNWDEFDRLVGKVAPVETASESPLELTEDRRAHVIDAWKQARDSEREKLVAEAELAREEAKFRETAAAGKERYQKAARAMEVLKKDRWRGTTQLRSDAEVGSVGTIPPAILSGTATVVRVDETWGVLATVQYILTTGGYPQFVPDGRGGGSSRDVPVKKELATWKLFLLVDDADSIEPGKKFRLTPDLYHLAGKAVAGDDLVPVLRSLKVKPEEMPD
jgi:hypothetical protein